MNKTLASLEDLTGEALRFVQDLVPSSDTATLVTLSGNLGAGKTAFTQAVARVLGVIDHVTSPTFVLEKIYRLPTQTTPEENTPPVFSTFKQLVHIDAYRLTRGSDLEPLGFHELMESPENLIMLEWPEKVLDALPKPALHIILEALPHGHHSISYA